MSSKSTGAALDVHIGIHTGLGIAGDVSGSLLREFTVMGDPVDARRRAEGSRAGRGDLGERGASPRNGRALRYAERPSAAARGSREALLPAFALRSTRERLHRARLGQHRRIFSSLVGRDRELAALRARLRRLRAGRAASSASSPRRGSGSRGSWPSWPHPRRREGLAWREGRSISTGQRLPFHPIADLCRSWVGIDDEDVPRRRSRSSRTASAACCPTRSKRPFPFSRCSSASRSTPPSRRASTRRAATPSSKLILLRRLGQLLRGSRVRPVVVVMDDLHWADVSSIELLESLLRLAADHPVLFVDLFRPGFASTSERVRQQASTLLPDRHLELVLRPLDHGAARALVNNLFRRSDVPHRLRHAIEEKAQGNPFYIEEVVRHLVDRGVVTLHEDGSFRATEKTASFVVPGTVQEVIRARLDGSGSTAGSSCSSPRWSAGRSIATSWRSWPRSRNASTTTSRNCSTPEFLVPSDRLPGLEYAFKHPLIHEVTYDGLLETHREELHRRVGAAIEARLSADVPGYLGMLAYHYGKGRDFERAEQFLFRAGDEAARVAAPSEALHFFQEASELYLRLHGAGGDPAKRALLESNVARALHHRGRFLEAIDHFDAALELLGDRVTRTPWRRALRAPGLGVAVVTRMVGPVRRRARPPATKRQCQILDLRYARAEATVTTSPTRHLFDSIDTIALLQRVDPRSVPGSGRMYAGAVALFAYGGISFGVSARLARTAHELVDPVDLDEYLYERAMNFTYRVLEGDWDERHEVDSASIERSLQNGQLWAPTTYLGLLGEKRIHRGDWKGAQECMDRIAGIWDLYQYDLAKTNHYYLRTLLPLERHEWDEAAVAADAYLEENPEDLLHILALSLRAKAETGLGDFDAAERTLARSAELMARCAPMPPFHASAHHRSRLALDVARLEAGDRVDRRVRQSAAAARRSAAKVAWRRTEVARLLGRLHWLRGRHRNALHQYRRSVEFGARLGARPELARTYAELGARLGEGLADGLRAAPDRQECLRRARQLFADLGLRPDPARDGASDPI
jgi:tetratricopeptide (TPR) repeat protein